MHNHIRTAEAGLPAAADLMLALRSALQAPPPGPAWGGELETRFQHFQKTEALGRAALGVAHEFNNLLGVVSGYAELLLENPSLDARAREEAGEIRKAADRAAALARELLNFGRRQATATATADLGSVVASIRQILQCVVGNSVRLVVVPCPEPCPVRVAPGPVEQVLMNLVVNARDALQPEDGPVGERPSGAGGQVMVATGTVRLEQEQHHSHGVVPAGTYGRLVVSDTGCGMDAATQGRLFEPFYTTKEPGKGTGLGMSIIAAILQQSGGFITLWSERGRGTRFEVHWPLVAS